MANSQVIQEIIKALNLNVNRDKIPEPVPVIEVGRKSKSTLIAGNSSSGSGTITIMSASTGPATRGDVYITGVMMSYVKNATCDVASGTMSLNGTINGATTTITQLPLLTLTADNAQIALEFTQPIKLDLNSALTQASTYTAGAMVRSIIVYYYIDETSRA